MPSSWQRRFNASSVEVRRRIKDPVESAYVEELRRLPDFIAAHEPDGLAVADFDGWGPSVKTLRTFIASYHELLHLVGEALLA
jgi:transaldolase